MVQVKATHSLLQCQNVENRFKKSIVRFFNPRFFFLLTQGSYLSCGDKAADSWSSQNKIEKFGESQTNLPESIETCLPCLVFPCWQSLCHMAVNKAGHQRKTMNNERSAFMTRT